MSGRIPCIWYGCPNPGIHKIVMPDAKLAGICQRHEDALAIMLRPPEGALAVSLELLANHDTKYLAARPNTPTIYESGVKLKTTHGPQLDIAACLERGEADIDSLTAWRCAEYRAQGVDAQIELVQIPRPDGGVTYTCRLKLPDGTEDVQEKLKPKDPVGDTFAQRFAAALDEIEAFFKWFCCEGNADQKPCSPDCPKKRALAMVAELRKEYLDGDSDKSR